MEYRPGSSKLPQIMFSGLKSQSRKDVHVDSLPFYSLLRGLTFSSEMPETRSTVCLERWAL